MKKKILALIMVVVLAATVVVGGTMAYLTDEDSATNIFTVGNISIDLTEKVGVVGGGEVVSTDDGAEYTGVMPGDWLQKEVTVTNDGVNDAYVMVTVTVNNFDKINAIIEAAGDDDENAEALLDEIFDGWGMTVMDRYVGEDQVKDMSYKINELVDDHILHVDSAKRINANVTAHFSIENWFKSEA